MSTTDPNIGLPNPTPGVDSGPVYAEQVSAFLTALAAAGHTGSANNDLPQIQTAGLNINADLPFNNKNINAVSSLRFNVLSATPSGILDVASIYVLNGNLCYNTTSGQSVQLTTGSSINVTSINTWNYQFINTNTSIPNNSSTNYFGMDSTGGSFTVTLPTAVSVSTKFIMFKDLSGSANAAANTIYIAPPAGNTLDGSSSSIAINTPFQAYALLSDGESNWQVYSTYKLAGTTLVLSGNFSINNNNVCSYYMIDTRTGSSIVTLPQLAYVPQGTKIIFIDVYGSSGTHSIQISPYSGDTINTSSTPRLIASTYGTLNLVASQVTWSVV